MARYGIAAAIGCLYVAGAAWIVRSEGEAYRNALHHARKTAAPDSGSPKPDNGNEAKSPSRGGEAAAPLLTDQEPAGARPKQLASTKPMVVAPGTEPPPALPPGGKPKDDLPQPVDPGVLWADSLDLSTLKPQDERRLGSELHRVIMTYNTAWADVTLEQRVEEAADPLLKLRSRKDLEYKFTILDSPAMNAFSHPGGYVYLSRGLLFNLIGEGQDTDENENYALQFVLGVEIAHVDDGHALKCVKDANQEEKKKGLGTLAQFYLLIGLGYPDAMVFEADAWVLKRMMVDLDRSRYEALSFPRMFEGYASSHGFANGRQLPALPDADPPANASQTPPSLVENHFRALTAAKLRLSKLKALSESLTKPAANPPK